MYWRLSEGYSINLVSGGNSINPMSGGGGQRQPHLMKVWGIKHQPHALKIVRGKHWSGAEVVWGIMHQSHVSKPGWGKASTHALWWIGVNVSTPSKVFTYKYIRYIYNICTSVQKLKILLILKVLSKIVVDDIIIFFLAGLDGSVGCTSEVVDSTPAGSATFFSWRYEI